MPDPTPTASPPDPPAEPMMTIVIAFLAPMFLWVGDIALARAAAVETLNAYRIASHRSLFTAAKIIAFDLATLCSLSQSMAEDIAIPLALRLRNNANSMDRAAERNRQALETEQRAAIAAKTARFSEEAAVAAAQQAVHEAKAATRAAPAPAAPPATPPRTSTPAASPAMPPRISALAAQPVPALRASAPAAPPATPSAPAPQPRTQATPPAPAPRHPAPATDQQWNAAWADAMAQVAAEFTAGLPGLPPAERAAELMRIQTLTDAAKALASGSQVSFADIPGLSAGP
ncbi:MAG: hypothetical protein ACJ8AW_17055 [Rhodopila sp.]